MEKRDDDSLDFEASFNSPEFVAWGDSRLSQGSLFQRTINGFKKDPNRRVTTAKAHFGPNGKIWDSDAAAQATADSPLSRKLKGRHLQMIAIGGSIGTGLFVGAGRALAHGGPASLLIAISSIGIMLYCTVHALGELAVAFPVAGSFSSYSTRFLDPAWGFAMGWNYAIQWLVVLPLEIVAASITIDYWGTTISNAAWVAIFWFVIVTINLFGVRGYGEAEFIFAIVKVIAVVGFILLGIILNIGGGPGGTYIGGRFWVDPGAFNNGFKGLCSVFVNAAFAFGGTELVGLAAAETANPRRSLPTAVKQVFWRIALFYIISLLLIGLLVPWSDPRLINGQYTFTNNNARASPFVIAIQNAQIQVLPSVMNAVIMISVLSVGNSSIYGSSRTIAALAEQNQAPKIFATIDRQGRPIVAIAFASVLGFLAFLAASKNQYQAFQWMLALSGLSSILTWGSICLAHIRFRKAWRLQGHAVDDLSFRSQAGVIGSWIGFTINVLVLMAQFWTGFAPVGYSMMTGADNTENFFQAYLALPIVLVFYGGYKFYYKTPIMKCKDMDLHTGMRELNLAELIAEERLEQANWPKWKKAYKFVC